MPGVPEIKVSELENFFRKVQKQLPPTLRRSFRNKVVSDAAAGLAAAIRPFAPRRTGQLRKSLGRKKYTRWPIQYVGPRIPAGAHGHLLEAGTVVRRTRRGWLRGAAPPMRWFSAALRSAYPKISSAIERKIVNRTNEVFARLARKGR